MACIQLPVKYSLLTQPNRVSFIEFPLVENTVTDSNTNRVYRQQWRVILFDDGLDVDRITWPVIRITASLK